MRTPLSCNQVGDKSLLVANFYIVLGSHRATNSTIIETDNCLYGFLINPVNYRYALYTVKF